jgi:hypothetical protein
MKSLFSKFFVSPIDFSDTIENRKQVINYIKMQVEENYSAIGMGDPITLRMMEEENLKAFKELTKARNTGLLKNVIKTYSEIGMYDYSTFLMMYNEQLNASNKELEW